MKKNSSFLREFKHFFHYPPLSLNYGPEYYEDELLFISLNKHLQKWLQINIGLTIDLSDEHNVYKLAVAISDFAFHAYQSWGSLRDELNDDVKILRSAGYLVKDSCCIGVGGRPTMMIWRPAPDGIEHSKRVRWINLVDCGDKLKLRATDRKFVDGLKNLDNRRQQFKTLITDSILDLCCFDEREIADMVVMFLPRTAISAKQ